MYDVDEDIPTDEIINVNEWATHQVSITNGQQEKVRYVAVDSHPANNEYAHGWKEGYRACYTYLMSQLCAETNVLQLLIYFLFSELLYCLTLNLICDV